MSPADATISINSHSIARGRTSRPEPVARFQQLRLHLAARPIVEVRLQKRVEQGPLMKRDCLDRGPAGTLVYLEAIPFVKHLLGDCLPVQLATAGLTHVELRIVAATLLIVATLRPRFA
eukprot:CAMPEP_0179002280 /NCGR_PEP_ID=MMETSP0795-20121207/11904_1 /TAXON_ID=88552 /ORGANISM="Amoebophrya sp., Strain Ameob2" /LENGTH=118 /DNA_ID=CAMNT_0020695899 /DNA_START=189 /DNA_END=541 /DNA_ORIENTATION=+